MTKIYILGKDKVDKKQRECTEETIEMPLFGGEYDLPGFTTSDGYIFDNGYIRMRTEQLRRYMGLDEEDQVEPRNDHL